MIRSRQWWTFPLFFGSALETAGNALRVAGHYSPAATNPYIAMQVLVIITPAFFAAVHFAILGRLIRIFGREFCPFPPKLVVPAFVTLDVASLFIQGAGSGIAAVNEIDGKDTTTGSNIVVGGLCLQLLGYCAFDALAFIFAMRAIRAGPPHAPAHLWTKKVQVGAFVTLISAGLILLRSCFRTAEMAEGWIGRVAQTEWYYYVFDATPVTIAVLLMVFWHPRTWLTPLQEPKEMDEEATHEKAPHDQTMHVGDNINDSQETMKEHNVTDGKSEVPAMKAEA